VAAVFRNGFRFVLVLALLLLLSACRDSPPTQKSGDEQPRLRQPTPQERAKILATVKETWEYEAEPAGLINSYFHAHLRRPRLRPRLVGVRVSNVDPRFASVLVELRDPRGRRRGGRAVLVLKKEKDPGHGGWGYPLAGPAISFPLACTAATPQAVRDLLCLDPWSVFGYPRPRDHTQIEYTQRIPAPDLHAVVWRKVMLPGGVCGSSRPIRPHDYEYGPSALVHADVDLLWWNPVVVSSWSKPLFGDLDGDGHDEAALDVVCANGGGTAAGQLGFSDVIYKAVGKSMRVVGIVTPQQPLDPATSHVPLSHVVAIKRGQVVVSEAWYGAYDGTCCASGIAKTIWTYRRGKLRPAHTKTLRKPWSSPLRIYDVLAEPVVQELSAQRLTRIVARPDLRLAVELENLGNVVKRHVRVALTIDGPSPIVETRTVERVTPWQLHAPTVFFGNLGRLPLATKTTVTVEIDDPGTFPMRYPVIFTHG
jgi:hypothetical protein